MGSTTVSFLGQEYTFPNELQRYVGYMKEFEEMYDRLFSVLNERIKKKWYDYPDKEFKKILDNEAKRVISKLSSYDIYDVSLSDLVGKNKGYLYLDEMTKEEFEKRKQISIDAIREYRGELENAQSYAASQVTGSGMTLISNSVLAHMTFSALEANTIKKQMNKANEEFKRTMNAVSYQNSSTKERRENDLLFKSTYPKYADVVTLFVSELTEKFFEILEKYDIYRYSEVKPYNSQRSSELLDNVDLVDSANKKKVLIQAFQNCPYNANVYFKAIELELADVDLIQTIDTYEQRKPLVDLLHENADRLVSTTSKPKVLQNYISWLIQLEDKKKYEVWNEILAPKIVPLKTGIKKLNKIIGSDFDANILYNRLHAVSDLQTQKNIEAYIDEQVNDRDAYFIKNICGDEYFEIIFKSCNVNVKSLIELKEQVSKFLKQNFETINKQKDEEKRSKEKRTFIIVGIVIGVIIAVFVGKIVFSEVKKTSERKNFESLRSTMEKEIPIAVKEAFVDNTDIENIEVNTDFKKIEICAGQGKIKNNVTTLLYLDGNCNFGNLSDKEKFDYIANQNEKNSYTIYEVEHGYSQYTEYIDYYFLDKMNFYDCDDLVDLSEIDLKIIYNNDTYAAFHNNKTEYLVINNESKKIEE